MQTNLVKLLFLFVIAGVLTACNSNPSNQIEDRRGGTALLEPRDDRQVEVIPLGDESTAALGVLPGGYAEALLDDELIREYPPVVYFGYDQAAISDESMQVVKFYADRLVDNPHLSVVLEGHTDERGTPSYNLALGEKRAKSVAELMVMYGVDPTRITEISFGEEQPAVIGHDETAWGKNRRVEIKSQN